MPDCTCASRFAWFRCCTRMDKAIFPSVAVKVAVLVAAASGIPSKISVDTSRSSGTISRYSPWKTTGNPALAVMA